MKSTRISLLTPFLIGLLLLELSTSGLAKKGDRSYNDAFRAKQAPRASSESHQSALERKRAPIEERMRRNDKIARSKREALSPEGQQFSIDHLSNCLWSGVSDMSVDGNYAYCAFINGLVILDASNPTDPDSVSSLPCYGAVEGLSKQGDFIYLATSGSGLVIVNVHDPDHPVQVGTYNYWALTYDVVVEDTIAYVRGGPGLLLIDVSDPYHPELINSLSLDGWGRRVIVHDTLALLDSWSDGEVILVGIADPAQPSPIGNYSAPNYVEGIWLRDTLMFVACYDSGLVIVNLADPINPEPIARLSTKCWVYDIAVRDTLAYVADGCGLQIINVSDPANPTPLAATYTPVFAHSLLLRDDHVYLGGYLVDGVGIVDVSNPVSPWTAGVYEIADWVENVFVCDSLVLASTNSTDLMILNFSDPTHAEYLGRYDPPLYTWYGVYDAVVVDTLAYMAAGYGLAIADISDPTQPQDVGGLETSGFVRRVFVHDTLAYMIDIYSGLQIINVADPTSPHVEGSWSSPGGYANDVFVKDTVAYVAARDSGLQIINVADPANPHRVGVYAGSGIAYTVFVKDTLAFLSDAAGSGLIIVNVADPANPEFVGNGDSHTLPFGIHVTDNLAYIANSFSGLLIADISDPTSPASAATHETLGFAQGVFARDSLVWVADRNSLIAFKAGYHLFSGPVWNVSITGNDITGDGSPEDPFATIQHAIDVSDNGDTVLVADGTYTGAGNRDIDFNGKSIVVMSHHGAELTILDLEGSLADPHGGFYFHSGEDSTSILQGFTIQGGSVHGLVHLWGHGGGIHCRNSSPTVISCKLQGNEANDGGGAYFFNSSSAIVSCRFVDNGPSGNSVMNGGGIASWHSSLRIESCEFRGNAAEYGGGVFSGYDTCLTLTDCLVIGNNSRSDRGGGLNSYQGCLEATNCTFSGNSAAQGSGVYLHESSLNMESSILSFSIGGEAALCASAGNFPLLNCCDIFGNAGGDWVGCIAGQQGINGNFSLDPLFCDTGGGKYYLWETSPCAAENNSCQTLIGALPVTCHLPYDPSLPDTVRIGCPILVNPVSSCDSFPIPVYLWNDEPLAGFSLGFAYSDNSIEITSCSFAGGVIPMGGLFVTSQFAFPDDNRFLIGGFDSLGISPIPQGQGLLGTLYARILDGANTKIIDIDSAFVPSAGRWALSWVDTDTAGGYEYRLLSPQYADCDTGDALLDYFCGDANGSKVVNLADIVFLVQYIFNSGPTPCPLIIGDINCSGRINVADCAYLVQYIFNFGQPPCAACP